MSDKYTVVMCLKNATHHNNTNNIDRFVRIGLPSYLKFLDVSSVAEFVIICPKDDAETIDTKIVKQFPSIPWRVYNDTQLLHAGVTAGWARQQIAKLAISQLVRTDHYLLVDDDTILTKPFLYTDLFANDARLRLNKSDTMDFPFFFLWSNQLLDFDFDKVQDAKYYMGITPEIFHTQTVRDIVKYLVTRYGNTKLWQLKLQDNKFTEYGLYWIWLIKHGMIEKMYTTTDDAPLYDFAVTDDSQNLKKQMEDAFRKDTSHHFTFVQSSLKYTVDDIVKVIEPKLTGATRI